MRFASITMDVKKQATFESQKKYRYRFGTVLEACNDITCWQRNLPKEQATLGTHKWHRARPGIVQKHEASHR